MYVMSVVCFFYYDLESNNPGNNNYDSCFMKRAPDYQEERLWWTGDEVQRPNRGGWGLRIFKTYDCIEELWLVELSTSGIVQVSSLIVQELTIIIVILTVQTGLKMNEMCVFTSEEGMCSWIHVQRSVRSWSNINRGPAASPL